LPIIYLLLSSNLQHVIYHFSWNELTSIFIIDSSNRIKILNWCFGLTILKGQLLHSLCITCSTRYSCYLVTQISLVPIRASLYKFIITLLYKHNFSYKISVSSFIIFSHDTFLSFHVLQVTLTFQSINLYQLNMVSEV